MALVTRVSVASETAEAICRAAVAEARAGGLAVAVAVVDAEGAVLALVRMDGAAAPVAEFALDKAYTAATMGRSTEAFGARMASAPGLSLGLGSRARLLTWGGGLPILAEGRVVGGIGVSGATDAEDIACGRAALASVGLEPGT